MAANAGKRFASLAQRLIEVTPNLLGTLDTTITWRLEPHGSGTLLSLEHKGFDLDSPIGKAAFSGMGAGWPKVLAGISAVLDMLSVA